MKKISINLYLNNAQEMGVIPNFFMSEPYLKLSHVKTLQKKGYLYLQDRHWCLFPPVPYGEVVLDFYPVNRIWSTFIIDMQEINNTEYTLLDYNYLFSPTDFLTMTGGKWETFRKNVKKWPCLNKEYEYSDRKPKASQAGILIAEWLNFRRHDVHDGELLAQFAYFSDDPDIHRKFLYRGDELVAINAWDENWTFINYRVCFVKSCEHFLDEFARYLFYTDPDIIKKNKFVNDGGTLGNEGLEKFKDKMNPREKHCIYSWIKKGK